MKLLPTRGKRSKEKLPVLLASSFAADPTPQHLRLHPRLRTSEIPSPIPSTSHFGVDDTRPSIFLKASDRVA